MQALEEFVTEKLENQRKNNLLRTIQTFERYEGNVLNQDWINETFISFSCNDYLGFSTNEEIKSAANDALLGFGNGAGASRLITGNSFLYNVLEQKLSDFKEYEASCIFPNAYMANIGVISSLMGKDDLIIADKYVHASIIDGIKLAGSKFLRFKHNDTNDLERLLKTYRNKYKKCLVITEGVFSMTGDIAPVDKIYKLVKKHSCWFMLDDAHGFGVIKRGKGVAEMFGLSGKIDIETGNFSKAIGSYGGFVLASTSMINYLHNFARSLIYTTALPPYQIALTIVALDYLEKNSHLCEIPIKKAVYFAELMKLKSIPTSSIVPYIMGDNAKVLELSEKLHDKGFIVAAIRHPTVPKDQAMLRFTFSATHEDNDIQKLASCIYAELN